MNALLFQYNISKPYIKICNVSRGLSETVNCAHKRFRGHSHCEAKMWKLDFWDPYMAKDIQQLEGAQRRAARFVKKDYRHTTSVTGLLDELRWLPLFERCKHSFDGFLQGIE